VSGQDIIQSTDKAINPSEVISFVEASDCGAITSFIGKVRGRSGEKTVLSLEHDASAEAAKKAFTKILRDARQKWDIREAAVCYRVGQVPAGEVTLVIAVATIHRPEGFAACQFVIDRFKQVVSAKEIREDGEYWISAKT
jgi:molybdopterin synthase catalytic subunit